MRPLTCLSLAVASLLGSASAAAAAPTRTPSQLARAALVIRRDLGGGWSQSAAAPRSAPKLACQQPGGAHLPRELARAASATFAQSQQGPFAFEVSAVFGSATMAGQWWAGVVKPSLRLCFASVLSATFSGGVHLHATGSQMLALPGGPPKLARYRITGQATSSGQSTPVFFDVLLLRHGTDVGELQLSSFETPPSDRLEIQLARAVARRLQAT
jgi:hypothetical protein